MGVQLCHRHLLCGLSLVDMAALLADYYELALALTLLTRLVRRRSFSPRSMGAESSSLIFFREVLMCV